MPKERPSCKTIAREAGVSRMTVSMALRDHPRVAPETRQRIKEIAARQGYTPDPNLTELMRYLRKRDISKEEPVIALLNAQRRPLRELGPEVLRVREGAKQRAQELGFKTEDFWLHEPGMRLQRTVQILEARGIRGLVVLPVDSLADVFELPQDGFVGVATCGVAAKLGFNQVHPHFYQSMHVGVEQIKARGFQRIGFCMTEPEDERSNHLFYCYLSWYQRDIAKRNCIPPLMDREITDQALVDWVEKHQPDVVYSTNPGHLTALQEAGWRVPEDLSFVTLGSAEDAAEQTARVHIGYRKIGATAIDILKTKLANERLGPTDNPAVTLIRGEWVDGPTVPTGQPVPALA